MEFSHKQITLYRIQLYKQLSHPVESLAKTNHTVESSARQTHPVVRSATHKSPCKEFSYKQITLVISDEFILRKDQLQTSHPVESSAIHKQITV